MEKTEVWGLLINGHLQGWIKHQLRPSMSTCIRTKFVSVLCQKEKKGQASMWTCTSTHKHLLSHVCNGAALYFHRRPLPPKLPEAPSIQPTVGGKDQGGQACTLSPPDWRGVWSLWHDSQHGKSAALSLLLKHSSHSFSCSELQRETIAPPSTPIWRCRFRQKVAGKQLQWYFGAWVYAHITPK